MANNVTFAPAAQLQAESFPGWVLPASTIAKKTSFRAMPFCKSTNVTLTWNFQGAPKFVLSDWKLVPPPKRTKRTEWNREKLEFSRVTLHEVTQEREQSLGPSLAPWTCLCWLTVALGKSFWLSAHLQVSHQFHLPDLPRAQVATWAGFSSPGRQELVEFPHEMLSYLSRSWVTAMSPGWPHDFTRTACTAS